MSTIVALGDRRTTGVLALAGVRCIAASKDADVVAAWRSLDADVGLAILTLEARRALDGELDTRPDVLTVVMPS